VRGGIMAALVGLTVITSGCALGRAPDLGMRAGAAPTAHMATGGSLRAAAARYLAIAEPANRRLDTEVDGYADHEHDNLAAAESDLRAEAATERGFDMLLAGIAFPPRIAATAEALIRANQERIALTGLQARSSSIAGLLSFTSRHRAADAAVEAQVRIIRRDLGLPPPGNS
jgi:hypothetical protein